MDTRIQNAAFFALVVVSVAVPILVTRAVPKSATMAAGIASGTTQPCGYVRSLWSQDDALLDCLVDRCR